MTTIASDFQKAYVASDANLRWRFTWTGEGLDCFLVF